MLGSRRIFIMVGVAAVCCIIALYLDRTHHSPLLYESGKVFEKTYTPAIDNLSTGFGVSSQGDPVITTSSMHEPEKYIVFFRCQHQVIFWVESRDLWQRLQREDTVTISYYEELDRHNKFTGTYIFVGAVKK